MKAGSATVYATRMAGWPDGWMVMPNTSEPLGPQGFGNGNEVLLVGLVPKLTDDRP